jgi:transmembrane sensor
MADFVPSDDTESRASVWAVRASEGCLIPAQQQELDAWLAESPKHLGAYVRALAIWSDVDRIAALDRGSSIEAMPIEAMPIEAMPLQRSGRMRDAWRVAAVAAAFVAVVIGSLLTYDHVIGRLAAERGEVRRVALEDGSTLFLNSGSIAQVHYSKAERRIILRRGEASFKVTHNSARPFIVEAGNMSVTAVGTEFTVDLDHHEDGIDKGFAVTVLDGVVKVANIRAAGDAPPNMLTRDQRFVSVATGTWRTTLSPKEAGRQLAWRDGLLIFEGQRLGTAAAEVSRYSRQAVFVDDPTLARAEFVGTFRMGNAEAFARAAAAAFNAQIIERDDGLHLDRQQNSPSH